MSKLYLVQRKTWFNEYSAFDDPDCIKGGGVPVAVFATRKAANAHARVLEKQARQEASSPFLLLTGETYEYELELTDEQICAKIRELGLESPTPVKGKYSKHITWPTWYDSVAESLTPEQFDGLWALFAKLKVYEVVQVPLVD